MISFRSHIFNTLRCVRQQRRCEGSILSDTNYKNWPPPPTSEGDASVSTWVRRRSVASENNVNSGVLMHWMNLNYEEDWFGPRTFSAMLSLARKSRGKVQSSWIIKIIKLADKQINLKSATLYNEALRALCSTGDNLIEVIIVVELMSNNRILPNARTHTELLRLYCKLGRKREVYDTYRSIITDFSDHVYIKLSTIILLESGLLDSTQIKSIFDLICNYVHISKLDNLPTFFEAYQAADPGNSHTFIANCVSLYIREGGSVTKSFNKELSMLMDSLENNKVSVNSVPDIIDLHPFWRDLLSKVMRRGWQYVVCALLVATVWIPVMSMYIYYFGSIRGRELKKEVDEMDDFEMHRMLQSDQKIIITRRRRSSIRNVIRSNVDTIVVEKKLSEDELIKVSPKTYQPSTIPDGDTSGSQSSSHPVDRTLVSNRKEIVATLTPLSADHHVVHINESDFENKDLIVTPEPDTQQPGKPPSPVMTITCLGDSITENLQDRILKTIIKQRSRMTPEQLQTRYVVRNYGRQGGSVGTGDQPFKNTSAWIHLHAYNSTVIFFQFGHNDAKYSNWKGEEVFKHNYKAMLARIQGLSPPPKKIYAVISPPMFSIGEHTMNESIINNVIPGIIKEVVTELNQEGTQIGIVDLFNDIFGGVPLNKWKRDKLMRLDGIHPSDEGKRRIIGRYVSLLLNITITERSLPQGPLIHYMNRNAGHLHIALVGDLAIGGNGVPLKKTLQYRLRELLAKHYPNQVTVHSVHSDCATVATRESHEFESVPLEFREIGNISSIWKSLDAINPNIILLHVGHMDMRNGFDQDKDSDTFIQKYEELVKRLPSTNSEKPAYVIPIIPFPVFPGVDLLKFGINATLANNILPSLVRNATTQSEYIVETHSSFQETLFPSGIRPSRDGLRLLAGQIAPTIFRYLHQVTAPPIQRSSIVGQKIKGSKGQKHP